MWLIIFYKHIQKCLFINYFMDKCFFCKDNTVVTLSQLKKGKSAMVIQFQLDVNLKLKRRLLEMGFYCGAEVEVEEVSFLSEVILVSLNGYLLSLRKSIADKIEVKEVTGA